MRERLEIMVARRRARPPAPMPTLRWFAHARTMRHNETLGARFRGHLAAAGMADGPLSPRLGSSDIGNVSFVVPDDPPDARHHGRPGPAALGGVPRAGRDAARRTRSR